MQRSTVSLGGPAPRPSRRLCPRTRPPPALPRTAAPGRVGRGRWPRGSHSVTSLHSLPHKQPCGLVALTGVGRLTREAWPTAVATGSRTKGNACLQIVH